MATLMEMAADYRLAAAKLNLSLKRHQQAGDLTREELLSLQEALRETRALAVMLSSYYELPRNPGPYTVAGMYARAYDGNKD